MAGHIDDLGNGRYRLRVSIGSGATRQPFSKNIEAASMKEAETELALFVADIKRNKIPNPSQMTFSQFYALWDAKYAKRRLAADTTYKTYTKMIRNRILPVFESMKIQKITPLHLNSFYSNLEEKGMRLDNRHDSHLKNIARYEHWIEVIQGKAKKYNRTLTEKESNQVKRAQNEIKILKEKVEKTEVLSAEAVNYHHRILSSMFGKAVKWGILTENPCEKADPPTPEQPEISYIESDEQMDKIFEAIAKEPLKYQALVLLDMFTGMRRGEIISKEWPDINFEKGTIKIIKQTQIVEGKQKNRKLKNKSSERRLYLPQSVMDVLKALKTEQNAQKLLLGEKWHDFNKIFTQENGYQMHKDTASHWFPKFLKRNGIDHVKFHGLRHTFASLMADMGYDVPSAAAAMGHAQSSTYLNIYAHTFGNKHKVIADALQERYARKIKKLDTTLDTDSVKTG